MGDWVIAVGNPFGLGGTVTAGIVSARGRDIGSGPYDDFLQIDAPVNHGNSGGPTFNTEGEVVGVNTAIFSPSGGSVGIGFAIASDVVKNVVAQLKENGAVARGWLGVEIQPVTPDLADSLGVKDPSGALVAKETPSSPAATAGVKVGDVITAVNGDKVADPRELARRIAALGPKKVAELAILRNGSSQTIDVTLGSMPADKQLATLESPPGPTIRPRSPSLASPFSLREKAKRGSRWPKWIPIASRPTAASRLATSSSTPAARPPPEVLGGTPKRAVGTTGYPNATASLRFRSRLASTSNSHPGP